MDQKTVNKIMNMIHGEKPKNAIFFDFFLIKSELFFNVIFNQLIKRNSLKIILKISFI
jgi:hypothetical protein